MYPCLRYELSQLDHYYENVFHVYDIWFVYYDFVDLSPSQVQLKNQKVIKIL